MYYYIFATIFVLLIIWALGSYLVVRNIEEPRFTVIQWQEGYTIGEYAPYIIAETEVIGTYGDASSDGFRIIADYIFGNNTTRTSIAMTAPVLENESQNSTSEKIAMTVPVIDTENGENVRTVSFVLPSKYTIDTLPKPNNPQVTIRQVAAHKVAVLSFTWYPTAKRVAEKKSALQAMLERDGFEIDGEIQVARYNPPLSMPLMLRNEIIIPIK
jgi:hypothetical protein